MTLDLRECAFVGPALTEPFVRFELEAVLVKRDLLPATARLGKDFEHGWSWARRQIRELGAAGGPLRVYNHIVVPISRCLGYQTPVRQQEVATREGMENGGWLLHASDGVRLRAWSVGTDIDLDAPQRSGRAYRFSPMRSAQRVLLSSAERAGLLTDGDELRLLLCDPARADSHVVIPLSGGSGWRAQSLAPDSYRLLHALAGPRGLVALPEVLDAARLNQTRVTKELRTQARNAMEGFLRGVLEHTGNAEALDRRVDRGKLAQTLWREALILVYRLLFILKLESAADPARAFSFAATRLWRNALSPNQALGPLVRRHLDQGHDTGQMLERGLRAVFRIFRDGLSCSELAIAPLGGILFGASATPLLDGLQWGERAVALLLDRLLWTSPKDRERGRVHYGALDVEELGRVYEALLELEPGIADGPMARLRRANLEVVVPAHRALAYRDGAVSAADVGDLRQGSTAPPSGKTHAAWVEDIPSGRFYVRVGTGRKSSGSYYTPHAFVRFLVRETLGPLVAKRSPDSDPDPRAILALNILDPATGSGHFLVEACRYLGDALYAACRLCDEHAMAAEDAAQTAEACERDRLLARARALRQRVADLPDRDRALLAYLPSRVSEGGGSGLSQSRALALCRRLVAVHCLYGVDANSLAVELAKVSLWLESYADGLPLTFLDHRLVHGDSIAGPFFAQLSSLPVGGQAMDPLLARNVKIRLGAALDAALVEVGALEATFGADAADLVLKENAKLRMDAALQALRLLCRAWSGAAMLGERECDDEWLALASVVAETGAWPDVLTKRQADIVEAGSLALPWDLTFPEVFRPASGGQRPGGFDVVLGNPPWDIIQPNPREFLARFDLSILDARTNHDMRAMQNRLLADPCVSTEFKRYREGYARQYRLIERYFAHQSVVVNGRPTGGKLDAYRVFAERKLQLTGPEGAVGMVVPSAFHANEGATGIRRLYLAETRLEWCLSFENRRKLFDIDGRCKFALIVARRPGPTNVIRCGFYLTDFDQIDVAGKLLDYRRELIDASGGAHSTLLELRGVDDLAITRKMFVTGQNFAAWSAARGIMLGREAHMTDDAGRFTLLSSILPRNRSAADPGAADRLRRDGYLLVHEGKTIHQFADRWETPPRYVIARHRLADRPQFLTNTCYFRAACREIAGSTNERTSIAAIVPPGVICGHTINVERRPAGRPNAAALSLIGVMNSFAFDWALRQRSASHVSLFILANLPVPRVGMLADCFVAHAVLRLACNHRGFQPLWTEQMGRAWREMSPSYSWPVIAEEPDRWRLRAAVDAVVACAYGLDRADYQHVLASFSHKSFKSAPDLCVAAFDELSAKGLEAFYRDHDPYADIPLVVSVAQPAVMARAERPIAPAVPDLLRRSRVRSTLPAGSDR